MSSFSGRLRGSSVHWFTDNQAVPTMVEVGSRKAELQLIARRIFQFCVRNSMSLTVEWIPRGENTIADYISKMVDRDDWQVNPVLFQWLNNILAHTM